MQPLLVIDHLKKAHPSGGGSPLFDRIIANIYSGDRLMLLGPSGQGKSTLLRLLARLESFDGGSLSLQGLNSLHDSPPDWRRKVCYVPQEPAMLPTTILDNLQVVSRLHRESFNERLAQTLMKQVGLDQLDWQQEANALSGGQKQRLQLVRSMLLQPNVLLLDEVTSALDSLSKQAVEQMLTKWSEQEGKAFIWVTHDKEQASTVGNRIWFLNNGALLELTVDELVEPPSVAPSVEGATES